MRRKVVVTIPREAYEALVSQAERAERAVDQQASSLLKHLLLTGEVMTPIEYARIAGRSRTWVEEKVKAGLIPAIRDGNRWILRRADLIASGWMTPQAEAAPPTAPRPGGRSRPGRANDTPAGSSPSGLRA